MKIESGTGNGYYAHVTPEHSLSVSATSIPRQHYIAKVDQKAFQVIGEATPSSGTTNVLHIENTTADQTFTVTYMRLSQIGLSGGAAIPASTQYFEVGTGMMYSSGGSQVSPVNTYSGSVVQSGGAMYDTNPTLTGTFNRLDKHWPRVDAEEWSYSKEGALVIPPGSALTVRFEGTHTAGTLYARASYYVSDVDSLDT